MSLMHSTPCRVPEIPDVARGALVHQQDLRYRLSEMGGSFTKVLYGLGRGSNPKPEPRALHPKALG